MMVQYDSTEDEKAEKSPFQFGTWYPIESAPKTASRILVWVVPYPGAGYMTFARSDDIGNVQAVYLDGATHWTPCPRNPPSTDNRTDDAGSSAVSMNQPSKT